MGKPEKLLIKARFQKMKSSPKKAVQTSPSITFYTHGMLNLISFLIILFVAHVQFKTRGHERGDICMKKNLTATCSRKLL